MADFTQFEKTEPIVIAAAEERTYDKYWMSKLVVRSATPQKKSTIYAEFVPCRDSEDGLKEVKPDVSKDEIIVINVPDLFALVAESPTFAGAMEMVFKALKEYGVDNEIF